MLSRVQMYTLLQMRAQGGNIFSVLPRDLLRYTIVNASDASYDPNSDIARLLHHIAYGAKKDLVEIRRMLAKNPRLVLEAGNVMTRSCLLVIRTSPLECALGSGSPEIVAIVHKAFERITDERGVKVANALKVRETIYKRYRPHIEKMLDQKPYDFTCLLDVIKQSSPEDITADLNNKMPHESALRDAMEKFRAEFTPGLMKRAGMHFAYNEYCNYATAVHILALCHSEFENLRDGDNFDKNHLVAWQIFGFIERSFCADERIVFARNCFDDAIAGKALERSLEYKYQSGSYFLDAEGDSSHSGLGFENWVAGDPRRSVAFMGVFAQRFQNFLEGKQRSLLKLCIQDLSIRSEKKNHPCV